MTSQSDKDTFDAFKCPDCGHLQESDDDCEMCTFGADEEGWDSVRVAETKDGNLVEVNG
jgi:hypothetical protein